MNTIRNITQINEEELRRGIAGTSSSWHEQYSKTPWVYVGNLAHELTEGDVICVVSQFGEVEDLHLVRDAETGKSRGFAFVKYEDAKSGILAVDNLVGVSVCGRSLRVDHVDRYRLPKHIQEAEDEKQQHERNVGPGHAYANQELASKHTLQDGVDLFAPPPRASEEEKGDDKKKRKREDKHKRKEKKHKKEKKAKRSKKSSSSHKERRRRHSRDNYDSQSAESSRD